MALPIYRIQWDGKDAVGTGMTCPHLAASTPVQLKSKYELVGWNILTLKEFSVQIDPTFTPIVFVSGVRRTTAHRLPWDESLIPWFRSHGEPETFANGMPDGFHIDCLVQ